MAQTTFMAALRRRREAAGERTQRAELRRQLASYDTEAQRAELLEIIARHDEADAAPVLQLLEPLSTRRPATPFTGAGTARDAA